MQVNLMNYNYCVWLDKNEYRNVYFSSCLKACRRLAHNRQEHVGADLA